MDAPPSFMTLRTRRPGHDERSMSSVDSTYGSACDAPSATHDISRVSYHVKHLESFAQVLQESAGRAFPNRGRSSQRYSKVQALMLHWSCDDLFVLPELEDLEKCLREDYSFETDIFAIPSENAHLELMLKIGDMIKKHESEDTLFIVYYGGHARIDESRQSTWCATRHPSSPWLQWSAIQTLLERSASDVLILLDCCAGAASATFPNGQSTTETISASSWDAIAPDPGRYSFSHALIEVLQEWRLRTFSAAMLHAEVLARLKHPRPILINGKHFEARSTPVHFMMTSNHRAPSIELCRIVPQQRRPPSPPKELSYRPQHPGLGFPAARSVEQERLPAEEHVPPPDELIPGATEPDEDHPHVMISLALEDDQRLDLNAWEQWLSNFPALAKHVKVQGVFKSHSTLLLLSLPVMVWDLLPDDPACSFVAFIRSNNLLRAQAADPVTVGAEVAVGEQEDMMEPPELRRADTESFFSGTTLSPAIDGGSTFGGSTLRPGGLGRSRSIVSSIQQQQQHQDRRSAMAAGMRTEYARTPVPPQSSSVNLGGPLRNVASTTSLGMLQRQQTAPPTLPGGGYETDHTQPSLSETISRTMILNQARSSKKTTFIPDRDIPEGPPLAKHVVARLEEYFQREPEPNVAVTEFLASNLGVETADIHLWFHHRRQQERMKYNLQNLKIDDHPPEVKDGARMILPGQLNTLLEIYPSKSVLLVDLRSPTDFEKSHIHEAINLRAPLSFIQNTTLEMIEDTFVDDQSRRTFSKRFQSRCVVLYDRVVEFDWECPVADALFEKFRKKGWQGQCFILKGHYREFSASFDKHISGSKMSQEAKEYLDGLRQQPVPKDQEEADERHKRYDAWLKAFESEDHRVPPVELMPAKKMERTRAVEQHQKELEAEFESRFPQLYKKAQTLKPARTLSYASIKSPAPPYSAPFKPGSGSEWETLGEDTKGKQWEDDEYFDNLKAPLVGPLASGLDKMREAGLQSSSTGAKETAYPQHTEGYPADKLDKLGDPYGDDYDEIDPKSEGLKNDPAFQKAGNEKHEASTAAGTGGDEGSAKKGRKRPQIWGRLTARNSGR